MHLSSADPLGGQGMGPVLWFCIMTSTLMGLTKILYLFYLWLSGLLIKRLEFFKNQIYTRTDNYDRVTRITHDFLSLIVYYASQV